MASLIEDLSDPDALPCKTAGVRVIQTHISIVVVGDHYVYKIKKPVNFGFLDFTTLAKRRFYCGQELLLNRRLSTGIYLEVLPVYLQHHRHTLTGNRGAVVEYAVKMRRIPEEKLMKSLFDRGELTEAHLLGIASVLARFHAAAERSAEIDSYGTVEKFKVNTDENFEQIGKYIGLTVDPEVFASLEAWTDDFYRSNRKLFRRRQEAGRIRDCHGDLHMEHVCIMDGYPVIDCIEFNDRFRYSDTLADIAFLLMDLEYWGGAEEAERLWRYYRSAAGERDTGQLLTFYKVYRAIVRGKVNSFQADDERIGDAEREEAARRAEKYFRLAGSYIC